MAAGRGEFFQSFAEGLERIPAGNRQQPGRGRGKPGPGRGRGRVGRAKAGGEQQRQPTAAPSPVRGDELR